MVYIVVVLHYLIHCCPQSI